MDDVVEFAYAFDVHLNAILPGLVLIHIVELPVLYCMLITIRPIPFLSLTVLYSTHTSMYMIKAFTELVRNSFYGIF